MAERRKSKAELEVYVKQLEGENDELQNQLDQIADIAAPDEDADGNDEDSGN